MKLIKGIPYNEYMKDWKLKNPEREKLRRDKANLKNQEYRSDYYKKRRKYYNEYYKKYRKEHKEEIKKHQKKWSEKNREKLRNYDRIYRFNKKIKKIYELLLDDKL